MWLTADETLQKKKKKFSELENTAIEIIQNMPKRKKKKKRLDLKMISSFNPKME